MRLVARWLCVVAAAAVAAAAEEQQCERRPCVRQGQCAADEVVCPEGLQRREGASVCGCCPGCVAPIAEGGICSDESEAPCEDGTSCVDNKCTTGACARAAPGREAWVPRCERDGSFAAVQCKGRPGAGRCFCWAPDGSRLDGQRSWEAGATADAVAANMSCACSVRTWQLESAGRADEAPRCAADGSFEPLQCARGVCWCAQPRSGAPRGRVVPEGAARVLVCYDAQQVGLSYRRRCDSQLAARVLIGRTLAAHGSTAYGLPPVACDLDGSFGPVQLSEGSDQKRFCAWKDKERIESFAQEAASNDQMNCNCARDTIYLDNQLNCLGNGNYPLYGEDNGQYFCLDQDGYFMDFVNKPNDCSGETRLSL